MIQGFQGTKFRRGVIEYSNLFSHYDAQRNVTAYFAEIQDGGQDKKIAEMIEKSGDLALFILFKKAAEASVSRVSKRLRQQTLNSTDFYITESENGVMAVVGDLKAFLLQADAGAFPDIFDRCESQDKPTVIGKRLLPILEKINEVAEALRKASS